MRLKLLSEELRIAPDKLRCDAFEMWADLPPQKSAVTNEKIMTINKARQEGIPANSTYIYREFVDEEDNQVYYLQCRPDMNKIMLAHKLYPPIIISGLGIANHATENYAGNDTAPLPIKNYCG